MRIESFQRRPVRGLPTDNLGLGKTVGSIRFIDGGQLPRGKRIGRTHPDLGRHGTVLQHEPQGLAAGRQAGLGHQMGRHRQLTRWRTVHGYGPKYGPGSLGLADIDRITCACPAKQLRPGVRRLGQGQGRTALGRHHHDPSRVEINPGRGRGHIGQPTTVRRKTRRGFGRLGGGQQRHLPGADINHGDIGLGGVPRGAFAPGRKLPPASDRRIRRGGLEGDAGAIRRKNEIPYLPIRDQRSDPTWPVDIDQGQQGGKPHRPAKDLHIGDGRSSRTVRGFLRPGHCHGNGLAVRRKGHVEHIEGSPGQPSYLPRRQAQHRHLGGVLAVHKIGKQTPIRGETRFFTLLRGRRNDPIGPRGGCHHMNTRIRLFPVLAGTQADHGKGHQPSIGGHGEILRCGHTQRGTDGKRAVASPG